MSKSKDKKALRLDDRISLVEFMNRYKLNEHIRNYYFQKNDLLYIEKTEVEWKKLTNLT